MLASEKSTKIDVLSVERESLVIVCFGGAIRNVIPSFFMLSLVKYRKDFKFKGSKGLETMLTLRAR